MSWKDRAVAEAPQKSSWKDRAVVEETPKAREPFMGEGFVRGAIEALPAVGGLGGAVVGSAGGPAGTVGGGMLGAAGGKALENILEGFLGDDKTRQEVYMDPVNEAATEGLLGGAGGLVAKGGGMLSKYVKTPITNVLSRLSQPAAEGAEEVIQASRRMGTAPTKGMLTSEPMIQKMESSLAQTPTRAGQEVSDQFRDVQRALGETGEGLFKGQVTSESSNQLASKARGSMLTNIKDQLAPAVSVYKKIESEIPLIPIDKSSLARESKNIASLPYAKIIGSEESGFASQINQNLGAVKTLEELRNLKSYVGKKFNDPNLSSTMKHTAGEVYDKLGRMEQNAITRSVIKNVRDPVASNSISKEMINEIQGANKVYAKVSNELKEIAKQAGLGNIKNYADFQRKVSDLSDEKFIQKMFNTGNERLLNSVKKNFPQAFESMKKAKMVEIYDKSLTKGELSMPKLINNFKRLGPESKRLLLGQNSEAALKDLETVYNAIPNKVGPSGTPEGVVYTGFNPFSPRSWLNEASSAAKSHVLNNPEKFAKFKLKFPEVLAVEALKAPTKTDVARRKFLESTVPRGLLAPAMGDE